MGRTGLGVEIRERSIRLAFVHAGKTERRTLKINGQALLPTQPNIKHANRLAAEIKDKIRHGVFSIAEYFPDDADTASTTTGALTIAAQLDNWHKAQRLEASTLKGYSSGVKFWKQHLAGKTVKGLLHSDILTAMAKRPDLTGKTINNYICVLREAMQMAVLDKIVTSNPVAAIPKLKHQKPPVDPFTHAEADMICDYMHQHYPQQVANFAEFKFFTGLRTAESFGLKWPNVDMASKYITVKSTIVRGVEKESTKTHEARQVHLNGRAYAAIKAQAEHTRIAAGYVFKDPRYDTPWLEERAFNRTYWTPALKVLGIRYRRPYNTRHTYATRMLMVGMTPAFCAKQLGHSVEMFLRTYAKWLDGSHDDLEMQRMEASFSGKNPGKNLRNTGGL